MSLGVAQASSTAFMLKQALVSALWASDPASHEVESVTSTAQPPATVAGTSTTTASDTEVYAVDVDDDAYVHVEREPLRYRSAIPMTAAGFAIFGVSYAISSLTGAIIADTRDDERLERYGRRMIIPVVGPWLAIGHTDSATGAWFTGLAGVAQTAGVVIGTIGAVHLAQRRRLKTQHQVMVTGSPLLGGGQLGLAGRF